MKRREIAYILISFACLLTIYYIILSNTFVPKPVTDI